MINSIRHLQRPRAVQLEPNDSERAACIPDHTSADGFTTSGQHHQIQYRAVKLPLGQCPGRYVGEVAVIGAAEGGSTWCEGTSAW